MINLAKNTKFKLNQQCPCGTGRKYNECCFGELDWPTIVAEKVDPIKFMSARGRNLIFADRLFELLQFESEKQIEIASIKKAITPKFVSELYESVTQLWPPDTNLEWVYSRRKDPIAGLYVGDYEVGYLEQAVIRHSLYADKILLNDPFLNPHVISSKYNSIVHPECHLNQTLKNVNRFLLLLPWVEAGIVDFIHSPSDLDQSFGFDTIKRALQAKLDEKAHEELALSLDQAKQRHKMSGGELRSLLQSPDHQIIRVFEKIQPSGTEIEKQEFMDEVNRERKRDPNFLDSIDKLPNPQYTFWSTGGTIENAILSAAMAKAYIFTDIRFRWHVLQQEKNKFSSETSVWSPFSKAVQTAPFSFLNNVTLDVALEQIHIKLSRFF